MNGSENNDWLDSSPTRGNNKSVLPGLNSSSMPAGIDVEPDGVKLFSSQTFGEADEFFTNVQDGVLPLLQQTAKIGGSFMEAADFMGRHGQGVEKLVLFSEDARKGYVALSFGASTIAINYINGDATSAATMENVQSAFDVSGGKGIFNGTPAGEPADDHPTGQGAPIKLPEPNGAAPTVYDPHASRTIELGDNGSTYVVSGDAPDDLERLDPQDDIASWNEKFRDDLAHVAREQPEEPDPQIYY